MHVIRGTHLGIGVWTPLQESWFQHRLEGIRNGTFTALSGVQWRSAARGQKHVLKVSRSNNAFAEAHLGVDASPEANATLGADGPSEVDVMSGVEGPFEADAALGACMSISLTFTWY